MHMADALISPAVGGIMWAAAAGVAGYSIKKINNEMDDKKIPLMGVMGAFIFAAQMINFSIPVTGSSGHLGGGILLAALLGPYAGFLTMAAILFIQALFFADGGLLAYGCNVINLGFYTCFIAYPLIYKVITRKGFTARKIFAASITSAIIGLQLGSFSVVFETLLSGKTELHFGTFVLFMQPIHLAIGVVEGLVTAAVVTFIWKAVPEILEQSNICNNVSVADKFTTGAEKSDVNNRRSSSIKRILIILAIATVIIGGGLSWLASSNPDGLEWSIFKATGKAEPDSDEGGLHEKLAGVQDKTAILPDYDFKKDDNDINNNEAQSEASGTNTNNEYNNEDIVNPGTSISGLVGGLLTLALVVAIGLCISFFKRRRGAYRRKV